MRVVGVVIACCFLPKVLRQYKIPCLLAASSTTYDKESHNISDKTGSFGVYLTATTIRNLRGKLAVKLFSISIKFYERLWSIMDLKRSCHCFKRNRNFKGVLSSVYNLPGFCCEPNKIFTANIHSP